MRNSLWLSTVVKRGIWPRNGHGLVTTCRDASFWEAWHAIRRLADAVEMQSGSRFLVSTLGLLGMERTTPRIGII